MKEAFDPVLTRLSEFATDPFLRKMFSVRRSTLDFRKLLEPGSFTVIRVAGFQSISVRNPALFRLT